MVAINGANRNLTESLKTPDPAQKESYLKWAGILKTEAAKAKALVPSKIAALPADQQPALLDAYHKALDKFIVTVELLEKALGEGRWADANTALGELHQEKASGHEQFKND